MRRFTGRIKTILLLSITLLFISYQSVGQCPTNACTPFGFPTGGLSAGIYNVTLSSINNTSSHEGIEGEYVDNSCTMSTSLASGNTYSISVRTGPNFLENVRVWIDANNNGSFNTSSELYFSSNAVNGIHSGTITIPQTGITKNTFLRMRVASDLEGFGTPAPTPCFASEYGQHEDYAIMVLDAPPTTDFEAGNTAACGGVVQFADLSNGTPTSWLWNFGDGNTSSAQHPQHTYVGIGPYTVTLISTNANGSDTLVKPNYITPNYNVATASCVPGTATNAGLGFEAGIYNFTLNTLNNNSGGDTEGYQDYSCNMETSLFEGVPYAVSVTTGALFDEAVKIWIDLNNDGVFDSGEQVYSSTTGKIHTGNIIVPSGAVKDTLLRMRVSADYIGSPTPTACSTPQYSQVEDYGVRIIQNTNPPVADFEADNQITCDGTVLFTDLSINGATSWLWDFGDMTSSTNRNPTHTYTNLGTYTVTLTATNANGSDSIVKTSYVTFHDTIPTNACTPVTSNYCCEYGILNFNFNTISNSSANASVGYEDFTCKIRTRLSEGTSYAVSLQTGTAGNQTSRIWIDFNNNGIFNDTTELIFESIDAANPSGNVIISSTASITYNLPLRMRVVSDYASSSFNSCFNIIHGQAEDYTVIIEPNGQLPIADFSVNELVNCNGTFEFTNSSLNVPTSYLWSFGDGTTDTTTSPTHTYTSPGVYTVTLMTYNNVGADTLVKTNYVEYLNSPTQACVPTTVSYCCGTGIKRFKLETIDNTSSGATIPYEDFSCLESTTLQAGKKYPVTITTGNQISEHVVIWIDLNDDGTFDNDTELIYSSTDFGLHTDSVAIPAIAIYDTNLRMRVTSEQSSSPIPTGCSNLFNGQHEDYGIILTPPDTTDAVQNDLSVHINVYPNPAKEVVFISSWDDVKIISTSIYNILGELQLEEYTHPSTVYTEKLDRGMYMIRIQTNKGVFSQKLMIQ